MLPKAKPVELAPNAGLAGWVPNVAVVVAAGAAPKANGPRVLLETGVAFELLLPKLNGLAAAAAEPKVGCVVGASKAGFPNAKVDCVDVEVGAAVEVELVIAKPPNEAVVVVMLGVV